MLCYVNNMYFVLFFLFLFLIGFVLIGLLLCKCTNYFSINSIRGELI